MRPKTSGYTRTTIIGNYDLYPNEGYEFPVRDKPKITNSQKDSAMFPLNRKINEKVPRRKVEEEQPTALVDPVIGHLSTGRLRTIRNLTKQVRSQQISYDDQKRRYEWAVQTAEDEQEAEQIKLAKQKEIRQKEKRDRQIQELREGYKAQLEEFQRRKQKEADEELAYQEQLRKQYAEEDAREAKKVEKQRQLMLERREEFRKKNDEILMRREAKIEADLEAEKKIQKENAEIEMRRDERAGEEKKRRLMKTQMRMRVVEQRAKELEKETKKNDDFQSAADSAAEKTQIAQIAAREAKKKALAEERRQVWSQHQRERTARRKSGIKRPFPLKKEMADESVIAAQQDWLKTSRLKAYQRKQIQEREEREKAESREANQEQQQLMLSQQGQFDYTLQKLQSVIPSELGITVPKYDVTKTLR